MNRHIKVGLAMVASAAFGAAAVQTLSAGYRFRKETIAGVRHTEETRRCQPCSSLLA
jgi:hypothetical protein